MSKIDPRAEMITVYCLLIMHGNAAPCMLYGRFSNKIIQLFAFYKSCV